MYRRQLIALLAACAIAAAPTLRAEEAPVTVFAAASLTDVLKEIGANWAAEGHAAPKFSFASSSTLARQIEAGAPANLFASADEQWADWLQQRDLLLPDTRHSLLTNTLVLVEPKASVQPVTVDSGLDLAKLLGPDGRIATGDPAHVPAGIYAETALKSLGLWAQAEPRLARAESVRGALLLVEREETPVGIVYATDAAASKLVAVAGSFPASSHPPITYPFAVVKGNDTPETRAFLAYLAGPAARAVFTRAGFGFTP